MMRATWRGGWQRLRGGNRLTGVACALAAALLISPAAAWALPGRMAEIAAARQQQTGSPVQVVAQGIARLPRGDIAWTVRRIEAPTGEDGTAFEAFPVGFALADGGEVSLADDRGVLLALLGDGEAAFLPAGKSGDAASAGDAAAALYEIALVSAEELASGQALGTAAGNPFAAPKGESFDLELSRATLTAGQEAPLQAARSGAPVFFLQTSGAVQLVTPDGQTAELATGQFALLQGDVLIRGASDEPASFVVAAIGAAAGNRAKADGTPEARAGKGDRQRASGGGRGQTAGAAAGAAAGQAGGRQNRGQRGSNGGGGGRQGGQTGAPGAGGGTTAPQAPGGTPVVAPTATTVPAATPPVETPLDAATPTPETTAPDEVVEEIPASENGNDDEVIVDETPADDEPTVEDESPPTDEPSDSTDEPAESEQPADTSDETVIEEPAEEPAEEIVVPVEDVPADAAETDGPIEEPAADAATESIVAAPVEEPVDEVPVEEPAVVEEPVIEEPVVVEEVPAEVAPVEEVTPTP